MKLNQREKLLLLGAIIILSPFLAFRLVIKPIHEYLITQSDRIRNLEKRDSQINLLGLELQSLKKENQIQALSLSRRIDSILKQKNLKSRSRTVVEASSTGEQRLVLKLDQATLTELSDLIYSIEDAKPVVVVENIDINPSYQNKKLFRISAVLVSQ